MRQTSLFDIVDDARVAAARRAWTAEMPPDLDDEPVLYVDDETTGLKWLKGEDKPVGTAVWAPRRGCGWYLPWAHRGGGNLPRERVVAWKRRNLRGKHLKNLNTRFDLHMEREDGTDLVEGTGNTFGDVAHDAALLDDHRKRFNLEELSVDILGVPEGKLRLDISSGARIADLPAGEVAPYAIRDVQLVKLLDDALSPRLDEEDLRRVQAVENRVIPAVVEMERNGSPIDMERLAAWRAEAHRRIDDLSWRLYRMTGLMIDPNKGADWLKLFLIRGLPVPGRTEKGAPSFTDKLLDKVDDEAVQIARQIAKLGSLCSKYLDKYWEDQRDGVLYYALNQLRTNHDETLGLKGTVSGRFSSSALWEGFGVNIQQVMSVGKQIEKLGHEFIVRRLFRPGRGGWLSADAKQIEYRIFAHYANSARILQAYRDDPNADFHAVVQKDLRRFAAVIAELEAAGNDERARKLTKNTNFAKMFGAGIAKVADMLGMDEGAARAFVRDYDRSFPEVGVLLQKASRVAETRGHVKTLLGRRSRFPDKQRLHKACNAAIQGSAADINKLTLADLYEAREELSIVLRSTVHDEANADALEPERLPEIQAFFDRQRLETRVPILWDAKIGRSWDVKHEPWRN